MIKKYFDLFAIGFFLVLCLIFFYPVVLQGKFPVPSDALVGLYHPWRDLYSETNPRGVPFKNFLITDPVRQQIPWRKQAIDEFKEGRIPTWNPYNFSGTPLSANIQAGIWNPFNIFFFILPFQTAWSFLIMLAPMLAGVFFYLYARHKKVHVAAALIGAITWSFSGFFISWLTWGTIDQTVLWLPLILLSIDHLLESPKNNRKSLIWSGILAASLISSFLAGHIQVALYIYGLAFVYGVFQVWNEKKKLNLWLVGSVLVGMAITSIQWIPFVQFLTVSSRLTDASAWLKDGWFLPWQHLVGFIAPDFFGNPATLNYFGVWNYGELTGYIGMLPVIFALGAACIRKDWLTRFFAIVTGLTFLFLFPTPIAKIPYLLHIPVLSTLQPTRLMVLIDFCLAMLAVLGLDHFFRNTNKKVYIGVGIVLIGLLLAWGFGAANPVSKRNLYVPSAVFASSVVLIGLLSIKKIRKTVLFAACIMLVVLDLFRFGWKFTPFTDAQYFFPETSVLKFLESQQKPFRILSLDNEILPPNTAAYYGIESVEGYDPIYNIRYEEFMAAVNRNAPNIDGPFGFNRIITVSSLASPLTPLLNAKYILTKNPLNDANMELMYSEGETKVYFYKPALPRMFAVDSVLSVSSNKQMIDMMYGSTFSVSKQAVTMDFDMPVAPTQPSDRVTILEGKSSTIMAESDLFNDHFVVILNVFDDGWKAFIDGVETKIYRTDYTFQGIVVPKGKHKIVLKYVTL